jgi:hypothetical protein
MCQRALLNGENIPTASELHNIDSINFVKFGLFFLLVKCTFLYFLYPHGGMTQVVKIATGRGTTLPHKAVLTIRLFSLQ